MTARRFLLLASGLVVLAAGAIAATPAPFDFAALQARARTLAQSPYVAPQGQVPAWMRQLSYDDLRRIDDAIRRILEL